LDYIKLKKYRLYLFGFSFLIFAECLLFISSVKFVVTYVYFYSYYDLCSSGHICLYQ